MASKTSDTMSQYIKWLNDIKTFATSEWLTDNQRPAFERIVKKWKSQPFVCLHGAAGCGKSFVARLLHKEHGYVYVADLNDAPANSDQVVLDGQAYDRNLRTIAQLKQLRRVVIVSRTLPKDDMPQANISLTQDDVNAFYGVLHRNNIINTFYEELNTTNLEQILKNEALKRMET